MHRLIEHTADMGIEAVAESVEELFAEAACALREMIFDGVQGAVREVRFIELFGGDYGELLVVWLNEILYHVDIKGFFPADFQMVEVRSDRLTARISGEPFDPERHPVQREVKAVTYHQLAVERLDGHWQARVYVDL